MSRARKSGIFRSRKTSGKSHTTRSRPRNISRQNEPGQKEGARHAAETATYIGNIAENPSAFKARLGQQEETKDPEIGIERQSTTRQPFKDRKSQICYREALFRRT